MSAQKYYSILVDAENSVFFVCFNAFTFPHLEVFGWEQFGYFVLFLYLDFFQRLVGAVLYPQASTSQLPSANRHWLRALSTKLVIISELICKQQEFFGWE